MGNEEQGREGEVRVLLNNPAYTYHRGNNEEMQMVHLLLGANRREGSISKEDFAKGFKQLVRDGLRFGEGSYALENSVKRIVGDI